MAEKLKIRDPETDTDKLFTVKPRTRSVVEAMDELGQRELEAAARLLEGLDLPSDGEPSTSEQRAAVIEATRRTTAAREDQVALQCEIVDALTEPAGGVTAGGLLLSRWEADDLTEAELDQVVEEAQKKSAKRPR